MFLLLYNMMLWMYIPVLGVQLSHSEPAHMLVLRVHLECQEHQLWRPGGLPRQRTVYATLASFPHSPSLLVPHRLQCFCSATYPRIFVLPTSGFDNCEHRVEAALTELRPSRVLALYLRRMGATAPPRPNLVLPHAQPSRRHLRSFLPPHDLLKRHQLPTVHIDHVQCAAFSTLDRARSDTRTGSQAEYLKSRRSRRAAFGASSTSSSSTTRRLRTRASSRPPSGTRAERRTRRTRTTGPSARARRTTLRRFGSSSIPASSSMTSS